MKTFVSDIYSWFVKVARTFAAEWPAVLRDPGVLIFFVILPLAYPVVYTLIYNPEVLREIPVVVVDADGTAASRSLVRDANASPTIHIAGYAANMDEAREAVATRNAFAILYIPAEYGRNIGRFETAHATFYCEMSLLLRYRDFASALADVQMKDISAITAERLNMAGLGTGATALPVDNQANMLGDTQQGFASFVMPAIVVLILQQSMVLGITMLGGTRRERRRRAGQPMADPGTAGAAATVLGRALCYTVFYVVWAIYLLHWIPALFNLPQAGNAVQYLALTLPLMLASAFMGQFFVLMVNDRETPFILIVLTSVLFLFLAGFTWPRYAFPSLWMWVSSWVPSTWGVEGFIRINSNGATLAQNADCYLWLWALAAMYFLLAVAAMRLIPRIENRRIRRHNAAGNAAGADSGATA